MNRSRTSPPRSRPPLEDTTNSPHSRTPSPPSPPYVDARSYLPKLRRKVSLRTFHPHVDSSEEIPSTHSSIYEASLVPSDEWIPSANMETIAATGDWDSSCVDLKTPPKRRLLPRKTHLAPPSATKSTTRKILNVHYPHYLETITEQRSFATLRSSLSLKSIRKQSFSLPAPHLPTLASPTPSRSPSPTPLTTIPRINHPMNPAPHRSPTPTGLPTFNTPEAANYRLPPPRLRFRDYFRPMGEGETEWRRQTMGLPRGVVMRGEGGILVRGRFRPNVGGMWERHPWVRGEGGGLGGKGQRGAEVAQQQTMQTSPDEIQGGVEAERQAAEGADNKWKKFWEVAGFVCCGIGETECGEERVRTNPREVQAVNARPVVSGGFV